MMSNVQLLHSLKIKSDYPILVHCCCAMVWQSRAGEETSYPGLIPRLWKPAVKCFLIQIESPNIQIFCPLQPSSGLPWRRCSVRQCMPRNLKQFLAKQHLICITSLGGQCKKICNAPGRIILVFLHLFLKVMRMSCSPNYSVRSGNTVTKLQRSVMRRET